MANGNMDLEQVYTFVSQKLDKIRRKRGSGFIGAIQKLSDEINPYLEEQHSGKFGKALLLHIFANEVLRYSIEDDYIDIDDVNSTLGEALQNLLKDEGWVNPKLQCFLEVLHRIGRKQDIQPQRVEFSCSTSHGDSRIVGLLQKPNQPPIPVSSKRFPFVSILEHSLTDPAYVQGVVDTFADHLAQLQATKGVSCLCFVEKAVGPVGALGMLSSLVSKLHLPACIYRASYWPSRARLTGYQPSPEDKIALVYDLLVTGSGIRQVANDLQERFGATVVAGVVLFGYDKAQNRQIVGDRTIEVQALCWQHTFARQIKKIQTGETTETKNITVLSNGRGSSHSPATRGGMGHSSSAYRGAPMNNHPRWIRPFSLYSSAELRALKFQSVNEFEQAIRLCWRDPNLKGVPRVSPDGITLIVPEEAVEYFKVNKLKFKVSDVLRTTDLSRVELMEMRRKHGM